ncbi:hypothetical protein [Flavobacterium sp.]|uniref:hypothetical protein n=1 Tax=Flavobacterium sp. TaxID=239 RepID=UPI0039E70694
MKKLIALLFVLSSTIGLQAQEVELNKKDEVQLDGKTILKYKKINARQYSFYSLEGDEILYYKLDDNETHQYIEDDFFILNFLTAKKKVETKNRSLVASGLGMNSAKNMAKLIKALLDEKVLDADGKLNLDKLDTFYEKYHENITARTVRY